MYRHQVNAHGSLTAIHHLRETTIGSGLTTIQDLGHTVALAVSEGPKNKAEELGLIIPSRSDIQDVEDSRVDNSGVPTDLAELFEQDAYETLDEFVEAGIEEWRKILPNLGNVVGMEVHAVPQQEEDSLFTSSGLLVVRNELIEDRPLSFLATQEEIEAMERIINGVGHEAPEEVTAIEQVDDGHTYGYL